MRIVRIRIKNFRCIREAEIFPLTHNVFLGPNNAGKTTILEALNLVLNPEFIMRSGVIDENDFFNRAYIPATDNEDDASHESLENGFLDTEYSQTNVYQEINEQECAETSIAPHEYPIIRIEIVLTELAPEDEDIFRKNIVPWNQDQNIVVESSEEGVDPFEGNDIAIRVVFEGWYNTEEDDFDCKTFFLPSEDMHRDDCITFTKTHKRHIGFLIYRDFRALTRPITLNPAQLFSRLLYSQEVKPKHFEQAMADLRNALHPMIHEDDFISLLKSYKTELEQFLFLSETRPSALSFQVTDGTRNRIKSEAQMYIRDSIELPIQKSGAGTRSLSILAILTLIMRRRGRGILALEEPETFLIPHAQRRVIDECLSLANQTFITTHSPYVLERVPVEGVGRIYRNISGDIRWSPILTDNVNAVNLYSKRLKQACCEALLGRGVVLVEGDSDKWWLLGVSKLLNRKEWNGRRQEALELIGVTVVSADTNGDILRLGNFFHEAGLCVVGVFDKLAADDPIWADVCNADYPCLFLKEAGLEELLSDRLPEEILRQMLSSAPYSKTDLVDEAKVAVMDEANVRASAFEMLRANKGSASLHEWVLSLLDETTLPTVLKDLIDLLSLYMTGELRVRMCSLAR